MYIHPGLEYVLLGTYGPEYRSFCAKKAFLGHSPKFKDTRTILDSAYIDLCQHLLQLLSKLWGKITFPNQFLITLPSKLCNAYPLWTILAMLSSKGALYQIRYDLSVNWSKLYTSTVPVLTGLKNTQFHVAAFLMWKERRFLNSYSAGSLHQHNFTTPWLVTIASFFTAWLLNSSVQSLHIIGTYVR